VLDGQSALRKPVARRRQAVFDYVIFDEASQVLREDAVSGILRDGRVVVAGDRNQLPPEPHVFARGA